jgi:hypothetical protein
MPFYDPELAEYSSSIPFKQATRFLIGHDRYSRDRVLINKYLLRMAFRDRLNDDVFYRQKAVSSSMHLLCGGALGGIMAAILKQDLERGDSFIRRYRLERTVNRYLQTATWAQAEDKFLLKIYIFATLCLYQRHVLCRSEIAGSIGS